MYSSFLPITITSVRVASIRLSHWIFMPHSTLISSFSAAPSGACSYHFSLCSNLLFLQVSQWNFVATLSCCLFCILFEPPFHVCLLCVAHFHHFSHTIYTRTFTGLIDIVLHIVCPDCLFLCDTQQCSCYNL